MPNARKSVHSETNRRRFFLTRGDYEWPEGILKRQVARGGAVSVRRPRLSVAQGRILCWKQPPILSRTCSTRHQAAVAARFASKRANGISVTNPAIATTTTMTVTLPSYPSLQVTVHELHELACTGNGMARGTMGTSTNR